MSTTNSPSYAQGVADGLDDQARIQMCPPGPPVGPTPPFPDYPVMYMRGYQSTYTGVWHVCTDLCPWRQAELEQQRRAEMADS